MMWPALGALLLAAAAAAPAAVSFHADFEGGNLAQWTEAGPGAYDIVLRRDANSDAFRWYSFKVLGAQGEEIAIRIPDASESQAPQAWDWDQPFASSDGGATWRRVEDTRYEDGAYTWTDMPRSDSEWYALAPPYSFERWTGLLDAIAEDPRVMELSVIGESLEGRPLHLLVLGAHGGAPESKPAFWITSRVHPAETGSSWQLEGFLEWVLSDDPEAERLLAGSTIGIVGMLNPDGVVRGHYRMDSNGENLNRHWDKDDPELFPTIVATRAAMRALQDAGGRILAFHDLHSHSSVRANFAYFSGTEAGLTQEQAEDVRAFLRLLESINPDFDAERTTGGAATRLGVAVAAGWRQFGIPHSYTFETSYQDIDYPPGGSMDIPRYKALGADLGRAFVRHFLASPESSG